MGQFKDLLLGVQQRLETLPGLKYIDKDWGQLRYEQPPVKYPCALVDMEQAGFSQLGKGYQLADVAITVTIANKRLVSASHKAPNRQDGYSTVELLESVHEALQLYYEKDYAPLVRTNIRKVYVDSAFEVYALIYQTQFTARRPDELIPTDAKSVKISINPVTDGLGFRDVEGTLDVK